MSASLRRAARAGLRRPWQALARSCPRIFIRGAGAGLPISGMCTPEQVWARIQPLTASVYLDRIADCRKEREAEDATGASHPLQRARAIERLWEVGAKLVRGYKDFSPRASQCATRIRHKTQHGIKLLEITKKRNKIIR